MSPEIWLWLTPSLVTLFLWGLGQGLVKKYVGDVSPARFCLFFICAKAVVNISYFMLQDHPSPLAPEGRAFMITSIAAALLDGTGWILYFRSILLGPITIVGTLSAAYPAVTAVFARIFLGEILTEPQYLGVVLVIGGCIGLSYERAEDATKQKNRAWILLAASALLLWGASQTTMKYAYSLPAANDANLALFGTMGGFATLGMYGLLYGRRRRDADDGKLSLFKEWSHSFCPWG
ncbi:MAG: EamA family transporter [Myxococcota bacterium]